ncbi:MAG: LamG-like jellyroll fold domain-containing protein [Armatimonadota bacterium]
MPYGRKFRGGVSSSTGVESADQVVRTGPNGKIDPSLLPAFNALPAVEGTPDPGTTLVPVYNPATSTNSYMTLTGVQGSGGAGVSEMDIARDNTAQLAYLRCADKAAVAYLLRNGFVDAMYDSSGLDLGTMQNGIYVAGTPGGAQNYDPTGMLMHFDNSGVEEGGRTVTGGPTGYVTSPKFGTHAADISAPGTYYTISAIGSEWTNYTGPYTVDFWLKVNSVQLGATYAPRIFNWTLDDAAPFGFLRNPSGTPQLLLMSSASGAQGVAYNLVLDEWHHYAMVKNGSTALTFLDGVKHATEVTNASAINYAH